MDVSNMSSVHGRRGAVLAVLAVLAVAALSTSTLVTPAGAQALPTATAAARCFEDGLGVVEVTFVDPTDSWSHHFLIDGEEAAAVTGGEDTYWVIVPGDGTYDVAITAETIEEQPAEILSTEITIDCDIDPAPTAPPTDDAAATRPLRFTG